MAIILSLDTATKRCSVVLADGARVLAFREEESERHTHAERLNVFIEEVLREAGLSMAALDAVAVGIGPGSYTGLRIGLSAAKGLCFALRIPLVGMSTLEVLLNELLAKDLVMPTDAALMPMVDARRMEVFTFSAERSGASPRSARPLVMDEAWLMSLPTDRFTVVFGDGADKASALWTGRTHVMHVPGIRPSNAGLATTADAHHRKGAFSDLAYLVPDYGKPANVTQPRKRFG
ncbi:MAG: tRNA (adenosine(37)-N6)-threonylcarbamoyltransferase complex dimerization subunit type 1 TsaB [Flavobacteriales bacterium]|nr:tRNA (adenosine(37)-N6)-threonylcarbamoyltransferase complex dimerization subunit type 1 TsaB [Flavobacteriales bacterium]